MISAHYNGKTITRNISVYKKWGNSGESGENKPAKHLNNLEKIEETKKTDKNIQYLVQIFNNESDYCGFDKEDASICSTISTENFESMNFI